MSTISPPLVVDLDGTLTPTDTLVESVLVAIKQSPLNLLRMPFWLLKGRASFKEEIATRAQLAIDRLPYREPFLQYLIEEKAKGRQLVLATAAHQRIANRVSSHLGLFDKVIATKGRCNLKGLEKLSAILEEVGDAFVYAGDSVADVPIWTAARGAVLVGASSRTAAMIRGTVPIEREFPNDQPGAPTWMRALRVHQWVKNLLLFVPILTAYSFYNLASLKDVLLAFAAFSLAASATYLVNDLWDLESDRIHPRKRQRPFASGKLKILHGLAAASVTLVAALMLASAVSPEFFLVLLAYLALTSAYSWLLKEQVILDVLILSILYTLRIIAGAVAVDVVLTSWLLAFSVFIFLSLALVKRCAELVSLQDSGGVAARGRDYRVSDLAVLWPLGVGAALSAVVVFGLFINAPETRDRYTAPSLLWLVALGLIYWLARLWIKTSRGEMHDDPVIYAAKDPGSRIVILCILAAMLAARFVRIETVL